MNIAHSTMINPEFLDDVVTYISSLENRHQLEIFLLGILTPKEILKICNRYQVAALLNEGWDQRAIADMLQIGIGTVTRISTKCQEGYFEYVI